MKFIVLITIFSASALHLAAQDTTGRKVVNITSTFKPVLKEAAKINFNASPQLTDTTAPGLSYNIPNQNLNFAFQPGSLRPLALQPDTSGGFSLDNYFKLGFGNFTTPFVQAGVSLGDGQRAGLNIYARHISSRGNIPLQDYSNSNVDLNAWFRNSKNMEWTARFGGFLEKYKKYGFEPRHLTFPSDSVDVKFQTWRGRLGMHNIRRTEFGLAYAPEIRVDVFSDRLGNSESNTFVNLPLEKRIGEKFQLDVAIAAGLNRYKPEQKNDISNHFVTFSPSLHFKSPAFALQAGIRPSWNNGEFRLLPNIITGIATSDKRFSFQAGWTGNFRYQGFQHMAGMNPWIWAPDSIRNSEVEERFAGFRGSAGDHFTYSAKVAYNRITNQPLYINSPGDGKSFMVINEPELKVFNFGGEAAFTVGERFSVISGVVFNQYKPSEQEKAWGLLPLEFTTNMKLQVLKDLYVNAGFFAFDGPWTQTDSGKSNLEGAVDLNAGAEFRIIRNLKLWAQFNNLLNREYQRWNQYPVYGFNFLGGVIFTFGENK